MKSEENETGDAVKAWAVGEDAEEEDYLSQKEAIREFHNPCSQYKR